MEDCIQCGCPHSNDNVICKRCEKENADRKVYQTPRRKVGELFVSLAVIAGIIAFTTDTSRQFMGFTVADINAMDMRRNVLIAAGVVAIIGVMLILNDKDETKK